MASLVSKYQEVARLSSRHLQRSVRAFHSRTRLYLAQNFTMPAMSPTMTEGNIASWKIKEGDSFSTGDVLLEIETDKAQMEIEAQDPGIMAKIMRPDGSKGVKVGVRIAVIAEPGDDISSLKFPPEESSPSLAQENHKASKESLMASIEPPLNSSDKAETPQSASSGPKQPVGKAQKQTYPLYPSVSQLLNDNGLSKSDADKIPASGPKGRLLKGDVLAYLGIIGSSYSADQSARIESLGRLDLSNIKAAAAKQAPQPKAGAPTSMPEMDTEISVFVSFKEVQEVQERIHKVLGIDIPLETFISRAVETSNLELPSASDAQPTTDDLFDQILGLNNVQKPNPAVFMPHILALHPVSLQVRKSITNKPDIIDMLVNNRWKEPLPSLLFKGGVDSELTGTNVFSIRVPKGQAKRAKVFLERMKTILQVDPGRLVL